jgi:hypothetical protein
VILLVRTWAVEVVALLAFLAVRPAAVSIPAAAGSAALRGCAACCAAAVAAAAAAVAIAAVAIALPAESDSVWVGVDVCVHCGVLEAIQLGSVHPEQGRRWQHSTAGAAGLRHVREAVAA